MKKVLLFLKKKHAYYAIVRYLLGWTMMFYAITKIMLTQFVLLPSSAWVKPLEQLPGTTIAWAFLGYSAWFEVLLGLLELVPSVLLLFRRTALLGGILMLPMTLNVFLINHALDLWDATKQISLVLLLLNIAVLLFNLRKLREIVVIIFSHTPKPKFVVWEVIVSVLVVGAAAFIGIPKLLDYKRNTNELTGDWFNRHPYEWTLQKETLNDSVLPLRTMKAYYDSYGSYTELNDTGWVKRGTTYYDLDKKKHTLWMYYGDKDSALFSYRMLNDTLLQLEKTVDSARGKKLVQVFKRRTINAKL